MDMFQCISHRQNKKEVKEEDTSKKYSDKNTSSDD